MANELIVALEEKGWTVSQGLEWHLGTSYVPHPVKTSSIYLLQKTYPQANNTGVIVSIHPYQDEFIVIDCAEHRTAEPSITIEVAQNLNDALALVQSSCDFWDAWLVSKQKK